MTILIYTRLSDTEGVVFMSIRTNENLKMQQQKTKLYKPFVLRSHAAACHPQLPASSSLPPFGAMSK